MSLLLFGLIMLSTLYALVFGSWWNSSAPFGIHLSILAFMLAVMGSAFLIINIYPRIKRRTLAHASGSRMGIKDWGQNISSKLSTPAAVLEGFNIKFANNAFLKELGLTGMRDAITDMPLSNLIHPNSQQALVDYMGSNELHHADETVLLRMLYVDGTTIPVHLSLSPLDNAEQSDQFLLQFTTTGPASPSLTAASDDLTCQLLINRIEQIVFHINVDQELIFLNPSWQRLLDYDIGESLNKPFLSFVHPEDIPMTEARLNDLTEGKRQQCLFELRLIAKNGQAHWFEIRASVSSRLKGERSSIIGTLTDINSAKLASSNRKANARSTTDMIMPNIPCVFYRCKNDRNWTFEFVSEGCLEVTEYQPYEITNSQYYNYTQLIYPDDRQRVWEHVQCQINKQRNFQIIYRILTRRNRVKWVMERGKGIFSSSGELLTLEGVIIDLSNDCYAELVNGLQLITASPSESLSDSET